MAESLTVRHVTRHALTGAVVCAAALGVAATVNVAGPDVSAEPVQAVPQSAGDQPDPEVVASERAEAERANRSSEREAEEARAKVAEALKKRNEALAKSQKATEDHDKELQKAKKAEAERKKAEERRKQLEDGYDAKTAKTPKEIGRQIAENKYGWTGAEFTCYDKLIMSESRWVIDATNPSSGAYGIPQSLPGNKMATEGDDWRTNPATQIKWGLKYVKERYGTPCAAWSFKQGHNWY